VTTLPELQVDLATMTANVAHVILADEDWSATLRGIHAALRPGGQLVFEARDPSRRPWLAWNRDTTYRHLDVPGVGAVETWWDLTEVDGDYVRGPAVRVAPRVAEHLAAEDYERYLGGLEIRVPPGLCEGRRKRVGQRVRVAVGDLEIDAGPDGRLLVGDVPGRVPPDLAHGQAQAVDCAAGPQALCDQGSLEHRGPPRS
jgi:hypothetical protein